MNNMNNNNNPNNYYNNYVSGYSDGQMLSVMNEFNCNNNNNSAVIERFHMRQNQLMQYPRKFVSMDGIQSGIPTNTTPTLTPTTLRNIEQALVEIINDPPASSPYQAGFVPPLAPFVNFNEVIDDNNSMGGSSESGSQSSWHTPSNHEDNSMATDTSSLGASHVNGGSPGMNVSTNGPSKSTTTRKNTGGRRPTKPSNLSPEEEEKRKVRRERNKLAAARCRKRRVDQTNDLQEKVEKLEKEKEALKKQIEDYNSLKDELNYSLESHRSDCRKNHNNNNNNTGLLRNSGGICLISQEHNQRSASPLDIKPIISKDTFDTKFIKDEPSDSSLDSLDDPPLPPKRLMLSSALPLTLPNVSTISTSIAAANTNMLNTPTITTSPPPPSSSLSIQSQSIYGHLQNQHNSNTKTRPSSLNVPLALKPSQTVSMNKMVNEMGVPISTPSSGILFNFDSLMDGGTGLTPVSGPLMPNCSSLNNKHPLELTTPTSEPSKLVSL